MADQLFSRHPHPGGPGAMLGAHRLRRRRTPAPLRPASAAAWRSVPSHGEFKTKKSRRTLALPLLAASWHAGAGLAGVFPNLVLLADIPEVLGMAGVVMLREQQRLLSALTARCRGDPLPCQAMI